MNVVIIVSDTYRWDYMGAYGNEWISTPHLDALAAESAVYDAAYAEGLPTIPARRVIMTGRNVFPFHYRPQPSDRVQTFGWHPLFDEDVTLAECLLDKGYHTALFNDCYHMMKPGKNFHRGFDQWFWIRGHESDCYAPADRAKVQHLLDKHFPGVDFPDSAWIIRHLVQRMNWKNEEDTFVAQTMQGAAQWVRDTSLDKPFYLHVEVFDPHEPWDPPREYAEKYLPTYGDSLSGCVSPGKVSQMSAQQFAEVKAAYAGEVSLVDRWTGHLLDALRERGVMDDTLVIFTSDHGCMMGEQDDVHKGYNRVRNQVTRLPLLIRHPDKECAGQRVTEFCQHQDLMPTVLSLLGEEIPDRVLGRNVWPTTADAEAAPDYVVSAFGRYASFRTAEWNYVRPWRELTARELQTEELYDLDADPEELTNVIDAHRDVADALSARLLEHIQKFAPLTSGTFQSLGPDNDDISYDALPRLDV